MRVTPDEVYKTEIIESEPRYVTVMCEMLSTELELVVFFPVASDGENG